MAKVRSNCEISKADFTDAFLLNTNRRSRSSKGVADTSVSKGKPNLLLSGEDLKQQVRSNTLRLAKVVYQMGEPSTTSSRHSFQSELWRWNGIINDKITARRGYRTWDVSYSCQNPAPEAISLWMRAHCKALSSKAKEKPSDTASLALLLAWVDREHDYIGHPWADGCGRMSTALVMWVAIMVEGGRLPVFASREEHYGAILSLEDHTRYFLGCLT